MQCTKEEQGTVALYLLPQDEKNNENEMLDIMVVQCGSN
jgi:hypothetical protein